MRRRRGGVVGAGAGGQDRAHVGSAEPAKRNRPAQRVNQSLFAVGGAKAEQNVEFGFQSGVADRSSTDEELLRFGSQCAESFLCLGFRARTTRGCGSGSVVVFIEDGHLTWADELVLGHDHTGRRFQQDQGAMIDHHRHGGTDEPLRHRVTS